MGKTSLDWMCKASPNQPSSAAWPTPPFYIPGTLQPHVSRFPSITLTGS
jgi:hypothetical protein